MELLQIFNPVDAEKSRYFSWPILRDYFLSIFPFSRFLGNHINFLSSPSFCPWIWQETVFLSNRHVGARPRFFCKNISIQLFPANCTQIAWMRLALKLKYFFGLRYILDTTSMYVLTYMREFLYVVDHRQLLHHPVKFDQMCLAWKLETLKSV